MIYRVAETILVSLLLLGFSSASCLATAHADDRLQETSQRINAVRKEHGLSTLKYNEKLAAAAQSQSDWMAKVGKMTHLRGQQATSFGAWKKSHHHTVNRIIQAGYMPWDKLFSLQVKDGKQVLVSAADANDYVGEVIAHGVPQSGPDRLQPKVIVAGWMNSPGHRKDVLNKGYQEMGVGFTLTKRGDAFWCVVFAKR